MLSCRPYKLSITRMEIFSKVITVEQIEEVVLRPINVYQRHTITNLRWKECKCRWQTPNVVCWCWFDAIVQCISETIQMNQYRRKYNIMLPNCQAMRFISSTSSFIMHSVELFCSFSPAHNHTITNTRTQWKNSFLLVSVFCCTDKCSF